MHGGRVEARSDGVGRGSEFVVRLPLGASSAAEAPAKAAAISAATQATARRVLVVDDNRDVADSFVVLLETLGLKVRVAYGGRAALEIAPAFKPEMVFLDLSMPEMDGYETARRLRQLPDGRGVQLFALTGWGQEEARLRAQEVGFDKHLTKPVEFGVLEGILAGRR
jgi:CheY-like chemotaxis protein